MELLQEIVEFHSMKVNPRDLVLSIRFLKCLLDEEALRKAPLVMMYLIFTQYTMGKVSHHVGGPCVASFIDHANIVAFAKKAAFVQEMETQFEDLRVKTLLA